MDSLVGGTTARLDNPRHISALDAYSPTIIGHVVVCGTESHRFVDSLMRIKDSRGSWRVLDMVDTATVISQDRNAQYSKGIAFEDLGGQVPQTLAVFVRHTMISAQTWSEPQIGPTILVERPAFPTRAPRTEAREMASAIGTTNCYELNGDDDDVQRIAAITIATYMAKAVVRRTHSPLLQAAKRLTPGEAGSTALVSVLSTTPV